MRPSKESVLMGIARSFSELSTCERAHVGVVIVRENRIISTGYNGSPKGRLHCDDVGCLVNQLGDCIRTVHAEANAITFAAKYGVALEGATLYTTMSPCYACSKLIINAGIKVVVYAEEYKDRSGIILLREGKVNVVQWP